MKKEIKLIEMFDNVRDEVFKLLKDKKIKLDDSYSLQVALVSLDKTIRGK